MVKQSLVLFIVVLTSLSSVALAQNAEASGQDTGVVGKEVEADSAREPGDESAVEAAKVKARELSAKAENLYNEGKFVDAANVFMDANKAYAHPINVFNAAKAFEKAAEYEKAADAYRKYLELYQTVLDETAPDATDVAKTIDFLKEKAFTALPEVTIDSDPIGADIYIDDPDKVLGQTPLSTHLPQGVHKVILKKNDFLGFEKEFEVRSREPLRLTFALEKIRREGGLRFVVNIRKARIYIDGKVVAVSPYNEVLVVDAGQHQVTIERDGYNQVSHLVDVKEGTTEVVSASLFLTKRSFSWRGGIGITSMILGAGGLGAALWLRSEVEKSSAGDTSWLWAGTPDFETYQTWTYVGYGVGGGLLALGTGLLIWELTRPKVNSEDLVDNHDRNRIPTFMVGMDDRSVMVGAVTRF